MTTTFESSEQFTEFVSEQIQVANFPKPVVHEKTTISPFVYWGYFQPEPGHFLVIKLDGMWHVDSFPCKPDKVALQGDDLSLLLADLNAQF